MNSFLFSIFSWMSFGLLKLSLGISWTETSYDNFCVHEGSFADTPPFVAQDTETGLIWVIDDDTDCDDNSTIVIYDPSEDTVTIDYELSNLIGGSFVFSDNDNGNNAAILDSIMYGVNGFGTIAGIALDNSSFYDSSITDLSGFYDFCVVSDTDRNLIYFIDENEFYVFDPSNDDFIQGRNLTYNHMDSACVIMDDYIYSISGRTRFIERYSLDGAQSATEVLNNGDWETLGTNLEDGYSKSICDVSAPEDLDHSGVFQLTAVSILNRYIMILGGSCCEYVDIDRAYSACSGLDELKAVTILDTETEEWYYSSDYDLPSARYNGKGIVSLDGNTVYYVLGANTDEVITTTIITADISDFDAILNASTGAGSDSSSIDINRFIYFGIILITLVGLFN